MDTFRRGGGGGGTEVQVAERGALAIELPMRSMGLSMSWQMSWNGMKGEVKVRITMEGPARMRITRTCSVLFRIMSLSMRLRMTWLVECWMKVRIMKAA